MDCQPTIHSIEENPIHTSIDPLYTLNSSILDKCCISDLHRAVIFSLLKRLKFWLMFELTNCRFYRETYATASKYLDMFFAQGNDVEIASLQTLGISCFMLAAKVVESRMPPISFDAFNRKDILKFEQKICFSFKFKLSPVTYVSLAELLLHSWDLYSN